jgi:hypothetical protein
MARANRLDATIMMATSVDQGVVKLEAARVKVLLIKSMVVNEDKKVADWARL